MEFSVLLEGQVAYPSKANEQQVFRAGIEQAMLADALGFDQFYADRPRNRVSSLQDEPPLLVIPSADPQDKPTVGVKVDEGGFFGDADRIVERQEQRHRPRPKLRRRAQRERSGRQRVRHAARRAVMFGEEDSVETGLLDSEHLVPKLHC
jgi:hypothetical protein